jgi:hypothetical protein
MVGVAADQRPPRIPSSLWTRVLLASVPAVFVILLLPHLADDRGRSPPIWLLLVAGVAIASVTAPALYVTIASTLRLPVRIAVLTVAYHALVILVKFTLAPFGLYETNAEVPLTGLVNVSDAVGAVVAAGMVFVLYLLAYVLIYRLVRRRIADLPPTAEARRKRRTHGLVLSVVAGAVLLSAAGGTLIVAFPLLFAVSGLEYLSFVFTSGVSLLVALALAGASVLAGMAFAATADRAQVVGDAAAFVSLFWVGLAFIALYHVLWVVFILVLVSTWPLRVVLPK